MLDNIYVYVNFAYSSGCKYDFAYVCLCFS